MFAVAVGDGGVLVPSGHARGPWDPGQMHGGAPAALAARALEGLATPVPMRCARLAVEFVGVVPLVPLTVTAQITRPGRRLTLAEAVVRAGDADVLRARATLLRRGDIALPAAAPDAPVPGPAEAQPARWVGSGDTGASFHLSAVELRFARGDWGRGPALAWFRLRRPLVDGETPTPLQRVAAVADFGNGVSRMLDFTEYLFINTDLTVHLHREPVGTWLALDARTDLDPSGVGQATSILRDETGRVGVAAQSLFVDVRS